MLIVAKCNSVISENPNVISPILDACRCTARTLGLPINASHFIRRPTQINTDLMQALLARVHQCPSRSWL